MVFGLPRTLIPIYITVFLDVLGLTILIPLLPALAQKLHSSPAIMGVALSVTAVFATLSSPLWGRLSDKVSRKTVLQISQCLRVSKKWCKFEPFSTALLYLVFPFFASSIDASLM